LVYGVGRRNLLQSNRILLLAYTPSRNKYSTTLLEDFTS
jgi:preprotein translocase subunit Sss1